MDRNLPKTKQTDAAAQDAGADPAEGPVSKSAHSPHHSRQAKIRGLIMDLPGSDGPVEVCVNNQADWELVYRKPALHVKCLEPSCDTYLTAKQMSRSGLRFFAIRSGGCTHNTVAILAECNEVAQNPSALAGGGGPEGAEHLWIKSRLYGIARALGLEAEVEDPLTRADVYLPQHKLALEYQRWNTDFTARTQQRASAGATRTLWLFPWQLPDDGPRALRMAFDKEVFDNGGIYVSVLSPSQNYEVQRPWQDASQEPTAFLFASGSIARFDSGPKGLVRSRLSLKTVLGQIVSDQRTLKQTYVWNSSEQRFVRGRVWVLREDLALAEAAREERRRLTRSSAVTSKHTHPDVAEKTEPQHETVVSGDRPRVSLDVSPSAPPAELLPSRTTAAPTDVVANPNSGATTPGPASTTALPDEHRPWWKSLADWFRAW